MADQSGRMRRGHRLDPDAGAGIDGHHLAGAHRQVQSAQDGPVAVVVREHDVPELDGVADGRAGGVDAARYVGIHRRVPLQRRLPKLS